MSISTNTPAIQSPAATSEQLIKKFSSVFDRQITAMEGERFHIALSSDAKLFCVKTPRTIPFAYRDKLKVELTTLQEQGIITPVMHPTEWCAPIVVTLKKDSNWVLISHTSTDT